MEHIRKASVQDASRLAEILIFAKRVHYRRIFCNDKVSFGEMQVVPLAQEYITDREKLDPVWVYDDEFVKGMIQIRQDEIRELYVDPFFQNAGIGTQLITFAIQEWDARWLWVLEKNERAIRFYQSHGFCMTGECRPEGGTTEFVIKMQRGVPAVQSSCTCNPICRQEKM